VLVTSVFKSGPTIAMRHRVLIVPAMDAGLARRYASITEANLINYSGMALEADGRRGWITGLGHRQPLNWPFELRYGREEAKRLAKPVIQARRPSASNPIPL